MQIITTISAANDGSYTLTPEESAEKILESVGGDPAKDSCIVTLAWKAETGSHGTAEPGMMPLP